MFITRIELHTPNLKEQALFYGETLGLDTRIIAGRQVLVRAGTTELLFTQADENWQGAYHFAFNIPENLFEEAKQWLLMRTNLLEDENGNNTTFDFKSWNSHSMYFKDAAGNILEFIARHEMKNAQDRFEILSVSEIGLASDDVFKFAKSLQKETGISPYKESSETFTPVGDADGLLIIVKRERIWYPNTNIPAQLLPVRVHFQIGETKAVLSGMPYQINVTI